MAAMPDATARGADAAFHRRQSRFEHAVGRVHDAAVDIARHFQVEQVGAVLGVVEGIGHRLVDRDYDGLGGGIGAVAAVNGNGFDFHEVSCDRRKGSQGLCGSTGRDAACALRAAPAPRSIPRPAARPGPGRPRG
jgi:hypothetical protein